MGFSFVLQSNGVAAYFMGKSAACKITIWHKSMCKGHNAESKKQGFVQGRLHYRRNNADGRLQSALRRYFLLQFTDIAKREGYPFPA